MTGACIPPVLLGYIQVMQPNALKSIRQAPSLRGLMGIYEQNYQRLLRLLPEMPLPFSAAVSRSGSDRLLYLQVLERTPYTTSIHLTYRFEENLRQIADPDMEIRLFHDACLAEVMACGMHPRSLNFGDFDFGNCSALEARWKRNLFLNKWLDYLLAHGHGFVMADRPRLVSVS